MNAKQKIKKNRFGGMTPRLHGHTKIVFTDKFGRESVKLDKDNLVTDAIQKIFESNFFGSIDYSYLMPAIKKTLGGVVLFENSLGSDPTDIWIPTSFDNPITAHAGQTVPASLADDITRGLPNSAASVALVNGYKLVWNFPETQGNGDIAAVGLCHSDFGDYALKDEAFKPLEMISNDSVKSVTWAEDDERLKIINVYDNVNGYSYSLAFPSVTINTNGQMALNANQNVKVKRRKNQLLNNLTVDMSHFLGNEVAEETFELSWYMSTLTPGAISDVALPSIFIDNTNNLFWIAFAYGNNSQSLALAYDMTAFTDGAVLSSVKTQSLNAVIGSNFPTQGIITAGPDGYIPSMIPSDQKWKFKLASYDDTNKEFALESFTSLELASFNYGQRFPNIQPLGNYYLVRGNRVADFTKLIEVDTDNDITRAYNVAPESSAATVTPYHIDNSNPIVGAEQWTYSPVRFVMGKSGTAINKLYLATKNDLPATITKTAANSMRVEYTLTYA